MTRTHRAALILGVGITLTILPYSARPALASAPSRQVFVFLIDRVSFEDLMSVSQVAALARAGGAGLMNIRPGPGDQGLGAYLTIGAGARAEVPSASRVDPRGSALPPGALTELVDANELAVPGLLGSVLEANGLRATARTSAGGPDIPGMLVAMDRRGTVAGGPVAAADLVVVNLGEARRQALAAVGAQIETMVSESTAAEVLVIVATPSVSEDMRERGDVSTPIVMARGTPTSVFAAAGPQHALTSTSVRFTGIVAGDDIAPTVLSFFDIAAPAEMTGAVLGVTSEPAPFALHRRELELRRIRVPVATSFGLGGLAVALVAGAIALIGRRPSRAILTALVLASLAAEAIPLGLLAAGLLPSLTYAQVVPTVIATIVAVGALAWVVPQRDPGWPITVVAMACAAAVLVDAAFGFRAMATTVAGVSVFEGRSYGVRNYYVGPLLAGAVLFACRLKPPHAFLLVLGAAAFAGFPRVGANVGGCATLLAAAPLLALRLKEGRTRLVHWLAAAGTVVVGLALVFAGDALLNPTPTHAGRFAQRVADTGWSSFAGVAWSRLGATLATINSVPPAWILIAWYAVMMVWVPRIGGEIGGALDRSPGLRAALWVLPVAGLLAVLFNDTGISTAIGASSFAIVGLAAPALVLWHDRRPGTHAGPIRGLVRSRP